MPEWYADTNSGFLHALRGTELKFLSYDTLSQIERAGGTSIVGGEVAVDSTGIALCLGVSERHLRFLGANSHENYRIFELRKKSGGARTIHAPKMQIKSVQQFILDHVLDEEENSAAVHSFLRKSPTETRNAVSNATVHKGQSFVASIDIKDYFSSVRHTAVLDLFNSLEKVIFSENAASLLTDLCTLKGPDRERLGIPQGAPTSPAISNLILADFDRPMLEASDELEVNYSRYADDLTFSGEFRRSTLFAMSIAKKRLQELGFQLAPKKTRVLSHRSQQRVTGAVVNEMVLPPRKLRREVRAFFHRSRRDWTSLGPAERMRRLQVMQVYVSYFNMFDDYPSSHIAQMRNIIRRLK